MPAWLLPVASAVIGGITNILSNDAQAEAEKKRANAALALMDRSIVDDNELASILRKQTRTFNVGLQNTLNTTAIRSRGLANPGVVGAAAGGQIEGAKAMSLATTEEKVRESNSDIRAKQAYIKASGTAYSDPVGSFTEGAISGGIAGVRAMNLFKMDTPDLGVMETGAVQGFNNNPLLSQESQGLINKWQNWEPYGSYKFTN